MKHTKIDIVDEITLMRKENDRLKKRLDRINNLFNQAQNLVEVVKLEMIDIKRNVETLQREMQNGKII
jgi:regulator of replication initiation timing